jgi:glycosyltransferase involved in cell wall biosynthesis
VKNRLKVLGLFAGERRDGRPTACDAYRLIFPYRLLNANGHKADWMPVEAAFRATAMGRLDPAQYDLFVLARMLTPDPSDAEKFVTTLQKAGKKVVCEWDDDYTNTHRDVTSGNDALAILEMCDAATASTPHLRDVMEQYNDNVYVLPNTIEMAMWEPYAPDELRIRDELTVGLVGTKTHADDWRPVGPALHAIAEDYPEVRFFIGGFLPDYLKGLPRLDVCPGVSFEAYPGLIRQIDIGLAPLAPDDHFNKSKSGVKALEYMASKRRLRDGSYGGAAPVVTNCKVYRRVCNNRHNALFVRDHYDSGEWYARIAKLIEDEHLRHRLQRQGHEWVVERRTVENHWRKWLNAYRAII